MWTLLILLLADTSYAYSLSNNTRTPSHVMSQKRGKHNALNVGEVHRAEDGSGGTRRAARSTTGRKGRVSGTEIKAGEAEWLIKKISYHFLTIRINTCAEN